MVNPLRLKVKGFIMNKLPRDKQRTILSMLVEGNSIRSIERMTGVHRDTIMRLGLAAGEHCERILDERMRGLECHSLQVDEVWCYVQKKQRHLTKAEKEAKRIGDQYVFVALDASTKLVVSYRVGKRSTDNTFLFLEELRGRVRNTPQLTTDAFAPYPSAVENAFGANISYAQIIKMYEGISEGDARYSPPRVKEVLKSIISGNPDKRKISTSFVERGNLTIRMQMRRFTRLTNAFSKKLENLKAAVALHFAWYNLCRIHSSLRVTPAMQAGLEGRVWDLGELLPAS
ncbi:MAG: transposase [Myxococcales bacterium]|nr:MAG: transposase [Myxococcales bacterium]